MRTGKYSFTKKALEQAIFRQWNHQTVNALDDGGWNTNTALRYR